VTCADETSDYLRRARQSLSAAELLWREGYPSEATSRAYYAMFYAAQGLLRSEGVAVVKHSAVVSKFGELFARTRRMDPALHRMLIEAKEARELADYVMDREATAGSVEVRLAGAKAFLEAVEGQVGGTQ